ncbi:MAG: hypothetical protein Q9182_001829 [Xanthomendoza sp. 2 TL-2023]
MAGVFADEMNTTGFLGNMAVAYTDQLKQVDLSDADAPGETDISDDGTIPETQPHHHSCGDLESEPVAVSALERPILPKPDRLSSQSGHRRRSSIARQESPKAMQSTTRHPQTHNRRIRKPQNHSNGRPRKPSSSPRSHHEPEIAVGRVPTVKERKVARAKAKKMNLELETGWHNRAEKNAKKAEISRLNKVAAGGYIDPSILLEQESPEQEVRKRKQPSVKAPAHQEVELGFDEAGWAPGERERFWASITKGQTVKEPEIDLAGNIISTHAAVDDTEEWVNEDGMEDYSEFDGTILGPLPAYLDHVAEMNQESILPRRKRRCARDAPRHSFRKL